MCYKLPLEGVLDFVIESLNLVNVTETNFKGWNNLKLANK